MDAKQVKEAWAIVEQGGYDVSPKESLRVAQSYLDIKAKLDRAVVQELMNWISEKGMVLVPVEPTEEMIEVMANCYDPTWGYPNKSIGKEWASESYKAMINKR